MMVVSVGARVPVGKGLPVQGPAAGLAAPPRAALPHRPALWPLPAFKHSLLVVCSYRLNLGVRVTDIPYALLLPCAVCYSICV